MSHINDLHNASMDCAEMAFLAKMRNENVEAEKLFQQSLDLELKAITAIETTDEPTYSILHRSAATLALDCNNIRLAEKLIGKALSNEPPAEIAEELRDLMEQVHFRRHLQLRGITLDEDELQMSLAGQGVGFGVVQSHEFLQRVDDASKLIYRIVERRNKMPFRERGRLKQAVVNDYEVFLSVPRAASFAVTLKLGRPVQQQKLPGITKSADIVDEFMDLMGLLNKGQYKEIEDRIPNPAYRTNFIQLAKRLAPDGNDVKIVGFTTKRQGQEKFVEVTTPKAKISPPQIAQPSIPEVPEKVTIRGILKFADATHSETGQIKIVDENAHATIVKVPEGMMNDIVKPLWNSNVVVNGTRFSNFIMLEDIEEQ